MVVILPDFQRLSYHNTSFPGYVLCFLNVLRTVIRSDRTVKKTYLCAELLLNVLLTAASPHKQSVASCESKHPCQRWRVGVTSGLCPQTSRDSTRARRTPRQPLPLAENNVPAVPVGSGVFLETVYRLTPKDRGSGRRRHQHPHRQVPGAPQLAVFQRRLCPLSARHPSSPHFHCTARPAPGPTVLCMDRLSPPMTACRKPYFWKL